MTTRGDKLATVCGAYDVRGRVDRDFDDDLVTALGYATYAVMHREYSATQVVIAHDMRVDSPRLASLLCHGVDQAGGTPINVGLASTDQLYFGSGELNVPGIMVTASHNPAQWNGFKICGPGARGIALADLLGEIRDTAAEAPVVATTSAWPVDSTHATHLGETYVNRLHALTGIPRLGRALTVVADAGNGMAGAYVDTVLGGASINLIGLYTELDGTFPNHPANPLDESTLVDVKRAVVDHGADLGLAFDGDADRCFFIDETGNTCSASAIGALVATREISRARNAGQATPTVLHNALTTRAVPAAIEHAGGTPVRTPVGHSGIKQRMRQTGAVFALEHSAHYYFRDFYCADSGMLAACHVIKALGEAHTPLSELLSPFSAGALSGEINSTVSDPDATIERVKAACQAGEFGPGTVDELDGVTFNASDMWFNVRKSNTEPLVRFNAETTSADANRDITERVLAVVRA